MSMTLSERIIQLENERNEHAEAIAAIDRALAGVSAALGHFRELLPSDSSDQTQRVDVVIGQARSMRRRGRFTMTAEASVLEFIRSSAAPTTAQINAHWRAESRCGTANVTLLKLLKQRQIQRVADPAIRGSRYMIAQFSEANKTPSEQIASGVFAADELPASTARLQ
jgi:hypothetical protein